MSKAGRVGPCKRGCTQCEDDPKLASQLQSHDLAALQAMIRAWMVRMSPSFGVCPDNMAFERGALAHFSFANWSLQSRQPRANL